MKYKDQINNILKPREKNDYSALDLFAGCGGLSLGFEANGFSTTGYEMSEDACDSYNYNLQGICINKILTSNECYEQADAVIGGPPCQPFSVIGKQKGINDSRNGFPICIDAVNKLRPALFLFENVRGLLYKNKKYLETVIFDLKKFGYKVDVQILNAKHFEVPQNRERVFIVGHKKGKFQFPEKKSNIITSGEALGSLTKKIPEGARFLTKTMERYIDNYERASKCTNARDLHLDKPARTLTCRNLAGDTGDMHRLKMADGSRRKLTEQEAARLQSFPTWYKFMGTQKSKLVQIGNAVPPMLSFYVAKNVRQFLESNY